jgi:hypothetical protein
MAVGLLISPLIAVAIFLVGAIVWVLLSVMSGTKAESPPTGGTEAHTAARMREEGRNAGHR